jgi:similar to stage IV sporulation protein
VSFWRNFGEIWQVKLVSADPAGTMAALRDAGMVLWEPEMLDLLTWRFYIRASDGKKVEHIAKKRGDLFKITGKTGLIRKAMSLRKRPVLVLGMMLLLTLSLWVPSRIFFVRVEGNQRISARLIEEEAQKCGIFFGASRRMLRSQQVKNQLLERLPELDWAGVYSAGCVAVITVRERALEQEKEQNGGVCSIVAARDAVISSITVLRGNGICSAGQAVKAGQVLISGYTDCGISIRAERAEGEVLGYTQRKFAAIFPNDWVQRGTIQRTEKKYSIIIGKKQINFYKDSGISGASCAKIYEQKYITLPGGFQLPVSIVCEQRIYYDTVSAPQLDSQIYLQKFARQYVLSQTLAGRIEYTQEFFTDAEGYTRLDGFYGCLENLGVVRMEESVPNYGKND